ncbi:hypothetical protein HYN48_06665 [Flavobacterium magnum]|uniref:UDP-glycosyltransferase n=1 Tax=Flavobacterium magnum TaxID=2162713 RepID=A0A2S0RI67_9FLAO|nr:hypothetical protein [Flavobacterium magnum]AWA31423.1 hypothetical protein HYN48_06665 [Flavobacterium magnum]
MKTLGVVITDGVGFRNFVLTDFIPEASKVFDEVVLFSCLPHQVYDQYALPCSIVELEVFQESTATWFFRKAKEIAHLQLNRKGNFGIQDNFNTNRNAAMTLRGLATRFIFGLTRVCHSERWISMYQKLQQRSLRNHRVTKDYERLLESHAVDLLFFTHQRPSFIAPMIYAAEKGGIRTAAFIFSWDNLASKGRMAGNFDFYLVWSDLMKRDLLAFYRRITESQATVVGTPQFEPYIMERYGHTEAAFRRRFHIDNANPIILFTCNDSSSKNDPIYLDLLAHFISKGQLSRQVNLIVRTSPAEDPVRFKDIAEKYPFIIWNHPDWEIKRAAHQEAWSQRVPSQNDVNDLKSLLRFSDININVLSTITIDAFLFDKPVINPVFGNPENGLFDDQKFFSYWHLEALVKSQSTEIVKNETEYLDSLNALLQGNDARRTQRAAFVGLQIGKPLEGTSKRIAENLAGLSNASFRKSKNATHA